MFWSKQELSLPTTNTLRPTTRPSYVKEILCIIGAFALTAQVAYTLQHCYKTSIASLLTNSAANSTLGFGAIYAVSKSGSPRRDALLRAGQLTGLDISIPLQPNWTDQDVQRLKAPENSSLNTGSALAWLGHLNAIDQFLSTNDDSALIIEDDIDWDTRLRSHQIPATAYAIRKLLDTTSDGYYGSSNEWDVIWLGHCGDYFDASYGSNIKAIKSFTDPFMPLFEELHPWTQEFMDNIGANNDRQRLVHESVQPLCTFAYAITRSAAERIGNEIAAREPMRSKDQPCAAYDVRLLEACRDYGMKCISVNPELFHHADGESEIAVVDAGDTEEKNESEAGSGTEKLTHNIRCSARSRKWETLRSKLAGPGINSDLTIRELAEDPSECYIDDL